MNKFFLINPWSFILGYSLISSVFAIDIEVTLDYNSTEKINPYIYGVNQNHEALDSDANFTIRRLGGNRMSTFNWEECVENSGEGTNSSWNYISSSIVGVPWNDRNNPGIAYTKFHRDNMQNGMASIVTLPLQGYVAADANRTVNGGPHGATANRWKTLVYAKSDAFSLDPDTADAKVYLDESLNFLVNEFGLQGSDSGIHYFALGNEPGLWDNTHELIQETPVGIEEYLNKVVEAAKALKAVDPKAKIIFGEFAGINIYNFSQADEWATLKGNYSWVIDYFLDKLKLESDQIGYPLIDVISTHFYPQHKVDASGQFSSSGTVVRNSTSTNHYVRKARLDFTRSLWDSTYVEPSWLSGTHLGGEAHVLLKRLHNSVDKYFPGLEIMMGEFDYGHDSDISHGLSLADFLGAAGAHGLDIANRWDLNTSTQGGYTHSAYKLFRNYDGNEGTFGDVIISSSWNNVDSSSIWVSVDQSHSKMHLVLINKALSSSQNFNVTLGQEISNPSLEEVWGFGPGGSSLKQIENSGTINNQILSITLPAMSAYHVVLSADKILFDQPTDLRLMSAPRTKQMKVLLNQNHLEIYGVENGHLEVFNLQGQPQQIQSESHLRFIDGIQSKSSLSEVKYVHLNQLQAGVYFLKMKDRGGVQVHRFVVNH